MTAAGAWALADKASEPRPVSPFTPPAAAAAQEPHGDCCQKGQPGQHPNCPMKDGSAGKAAGGEAPVPEATKKCPYLAKLESAKPQDSKGAP